MKNYVVAVGIEKVQNFIYYSLTSHQQDSQSNSGTLSDVMAASSFISEELPADIEKISGKNKEDFLLNCSGKWIFDTKKEKETILTELDKLFEEYYKKFQGQLLLKYTCFEQKTETNENKLKAVLKASTKLKAAECLNGVLARKSNRNTLFNFVEVPSREADQDKSLGRKKKDDQTQSVEREKKNYSPFVDTINQLIPEEDPNGIKQNENHFRIAIIKADLDGMGDIFKKAKSYELYKKLSDLLTTWVSLDKLGKLTKNIHFSKKDSSSDFNVYPLYIAGDDIFFAVSVHQLLKGIDLCKGILKEINKRIQKINLQDSNDRPCLPGLSLSIGVELTFNREPIRYYYERVNHQLDDYAKKVKGIKMVKDPSETQLNESDKTEQKLPALKISLNETVFFQGLEKEMDYEIDESKITDRPFCVFKWSELLEDISNLNEAIANMKTDMNKNDDYQAHHFYYSLLEKINDPIINKNELSSSRKELRYSNAVLYHLLPQTWYLDSVNNESLKKQQEAEFTLIEPLIRQLLIGEKEQSLRFSVAERQRLEKYLRMLVLFSDPRFCLKDVHKTKTDREQKNVTEDGKRILVNKAIKYLYQKSLAPDNVKKIFVQLKSYKPIDYKGKENRQFIVRYRLKVQCFIESKRLWRIPMRRFVK